MLGCKHSVVSLEPDICRGIDFAGLADVELRHGERAPTDRAGTRDAVEFTSNSGRLVDTRTPEE
jgi:hypothetical protein